MRISNFVIATLVLVIGVAVVTFVRPTAAEDRPGAMTGKDVTLTGVVVDLQCKMTGKFPTADRAKCTADCIRAGVPAALETSDGLVILGRGNRGAGMMLMPLAMQQAEVKGKLYERDGVRYLDMTAIQAVGQVNQEQEEVEEAEEPEAGSQSDPNN